jgi:hypothetical protein
MAGGALAECKLNERSESQPAEKINRQSGGSSDPWATHEHLENWRHHTMLALQMRIFNCSLTPIDDGLESVASALHARLAQELSRPGNAPLRENAA